MEQNTEIDDALKKCVEVAPSHSQVVQVTGAEWRTGQESPCLCTLTPEYMRNPDWQQGITLFTVTDRICRIYPVEFSGQFAQFAKMNFKA